MLTKSHIIRESEQKQSFERIPGHTYLLILESLPERQEATTAQPQGQRHWQQPLGGAPSTSWTLVPASIISESSLYFLASGPSPTHFHQTIDTSTRMLQAKQLTEQGIAPPTSEQAAFRPSQCTAAPGHGPSNQKPQDQPPHLSGQAQAPESLAPLTREPTLALESASPSAGDNCTGTGWGLDLPNSKPARALGSASYTNRHTPAPGISQPSSLCDQITHLQARSSHGLSWDLTLPIRMPT